MDRTLEWIMREWAKKRMFIIPLTIFLVIMGIFAYMQNGVVVFGDQKIYWLFFAFLAMVPACICIMSFSDWLVEKWKARQAEQEEREEAERVEQEAQRPENRLKMMQANMTILRNWQPRIAPQIPNNFARIYKPDYERFLNKTLEQIKEICEIEEPMAKDVYPLLERLDPWVEIGVIEQVRTVWQECLDAEND